MLLTKIINLNCSTSIFLVDSDSLQLRYYLVNHLHFKFGGRCWVDPLNRLQSAVSQGILFYKLQQSSFNKSHQMTVELSTIKTQLSNRHMLLEYFSIFEYNILLALLVLT